MIIIYIRKKDYAKYEKSYPSNKNSNSKKVSFLSKTAREYPLKIYLLIRKEFRCVYVYNTVCMCVYQDKV